MSEENLSAEERALLGAWPKPGARPSLSPEQLADWLAGRADARTAERVERALSDDAGLRAALVAVRRGEREEPPSYELARLLALGPKPRPRTTSLAARFGTWWQPLSAATVLAVAAGVGWMLGLAMGGHYLSVASASARELFGAGPSL